MKSYHYVFTYVLIVQSNGAIVNSVKSRVKVELTLLLKVESKQ